MKNQKLKLALKGNAVFSTLSALMMLFFSDAIATWMGISFPGVLQFIGIGLLLFALSIIWVAQKKAIPVKEVKVIIWQDWLWVIGSVGIIVTQSFSLNLNGYIVLGVVALIVADFAVLQSRYS